MAARRAAALSNLKGDSMNVKDPRVVRVAEAIVALLDAVTPARTASGATTHYTSNRKGPHPPGKAARWCRENFRHMRGARKEGRDWVISVAAYERWADRNAASPPTRVLQGPWSPHAALEAAAV